jgi:hypothetical protein
VAEGCTPTGAAPATADGCVAACIAGGPNSFSAWATIAQQTSGLTMFRQYDQAQTAKKKRK